MQATACVGDTGGGADEGGVLLLVHHIVCDATSLALLAQDMWREYDRVAAPGDLKQLECESVRKCSPDHDARFFDYAQLQLAANQQTRTEALQYWRRLLEAPGGGREGSGGGIFEPLQLRHDLPPAALTGNPAVVSSRFLRVWNGVACTLLTLLSGAAGKTTQKPRKNIHI
eukprot:1195079-Prorocentrum_minimum.AAC.13